MDIRSQGPARAENRILYSSTNVKIFINFLLTRRYKKGGLRRHSLGGELSPNCFRFTLPYRDDRHHWQRCADACSTDCQLHQNLVRYSPSQQSDCERH